SYILTRRRAYIREMDYPTIRTSQNNSTSSYWIFTAIKSSKDQCDWAILSLPILFVLKLRRSIPWNYRLLIRYSLDCLFLNPAENSYEFMHLLLRDHFAVVELAPALRSTSAIQRLRVTEQLAFQGDASIDSLRMLLEDPDPGIRVAASRSLASIPSTAVGPI